MKVTRSQLVIALATSAALAMPLAAYAGGNEAASPQKANTPVAMETNSQATQTSDLIQAAKSAGSFNTWLAAIDKAGLTDMLKGGEYTVFAPTDEAFAKLPAGTLDTLLKDPTQLQQLLKHHIVADRMKAGDVPIGKMRSLSGENLDFEANRRHKMAIEGAVVILPDLAANNGVIHGIDKVLVVN